MTRLRSSGEPAVSPLTNTQPQQIPQGLLARLILLISQLSEKSYRYIVHGPDPIREEWDWKGWLKDGELDVEDDDDEDDENYPHSWAALEANCGPLIPKFLPENYKTASNQELLAHYQKVVESIEKRTETQNALAFCSYSLLTPARNAVLQTHYLRKAIMAWENAVARKELPQLKNAFYAILLICGNCDLGGKFNALFDVNLISHVIDTLLLTVLKNDPKFQFELICMLTVTWQKRGFEKFSLADRQKLTQNCTRVYDIGCTLLEIAAEISPNDMNIFNASMFLLSRHMAEHHKNNKKEWQSRMTDRALSKMVKSAITQPNPHVVYQCLSLINDITLDNKTSLDTLQRVHGHIMTTKILRNFWDVDPSIRERVHEMAIRITDRILQNNKSTLAIMTSAGCHRDVINVMTSSQDDEVISTSATFIHHIVAAQSSEELAREIASNEVSSFACDALIGDLQRVVEGQATEVPLQTTISSLSTFAGDLIAFDDAAEMFVSKEVMDEVVRVVISSDVKDATKDDLASFIQRCLTKSPKKTHDIIKSMGDDTMSKLFSQSKTGPRSMIKGAYDEIEAKP